MQSGRGSVWGEGGGDGGSGGQRQGASASPFFGWYKVAGDVGEGVECVYIDADDDEDDDDDSCHRDSARSTLGWAPKGSSSVPSSTGGGSRRGRVGSSSNPSRGTVGTPGSVPSGALGAGAWGSAPLGVPMDVPVAREGEVSLPEDARAGVRAGQEMIQRGLERSLGMLLSPSLRAWQRSGGSTAAVVATVVRNAPAAAVAPVAGAAGALKHTLTGMRNE